MFEKVRTHTVIIERTAVLALLLISWETFPRLGLVNPRLFPPLSGVLQHGVALLSNPQQVPNGFWTNLGVYLYEILSSFAIIAIVGSITGLVLAVYQGVAKSAEPIVLALYAIPHIILYPIFLISLGTGEPSKIAYGVFVGLPVMLVSMIAYAKQLDQTYLKVARVSGASFRQIVAHVVFRAMVPGIVSSLRLGLAGAIVGITVAELIASTAGMGFMLGWATYFSFGNDSTLFFLIILIVGIALAINFAYRTALLRLIK